MEPLRQASLPLYRAAAFEEDLRFYLGPAWREDVAANCRLPAVDRYRAHLRALVAASPLLLAAHAFTQNLAVASGGQILGRLVRRGLGLGEGEGGTAAFEYAGGPPKALKEAFKEAFDSLGEVLGQEEQNQVGALPCAVNICWAGPSTALAPPTS
jgi:heme oxygenase